MFSRVLLSRAGLSAPVAAPRICRGSLTMPLRAKILASKPETRAQMSTGRETPPGETEDVLFGSLYGLRTIELNRPAKLNSLNGSMIDKIVPRLLEWDKSDMANIVVMKGVGEKAFCAGGDVVALAQNNKEGEEGILKSTEYFAKEYALNHLIATYGTPYIAFMDGITMGGGVGLSVHAPIRIATERTVFAMPETTIGFFPDVGASFFLPKLAGSIGTYLALTSERLKGVNVLYSGIATHYLHSTTLPQLESRLAELQFKDYDNIESRLQMISDTIEEYNTGLPHDESILLAGELRRAIDRCFSKSTVERIIQALEAESGETEKWARRTIGTLGKRSRTAIHVSLAQLRLAKEWPIAKVFEREHQLAAKFMAHPDFAEGVSALLINKPPTEPKWQRLRPNVDSGGDAVKQFFTPTSGVAPLKLHNEIDFTEYPHRSVGLPTEEDVEALVREKRMGPRQVINHFVGKTKGRLGVKEVVEEIVNRKTKKDIDGNAKWIYD